MLPCSEGLDPSANESKQDANSCDSPLEHMFELFLDRNQRDPLLPSRELIPGGPGHGRATVISWQSPMDIGTVEPKFVPTLVGLLHRVLDVIGARPQLNLGSSSDRDLFPSLLRLDDEKGFP